VFLRAQCVRPVPQRNFPALRLLLLPLLIRLAVLGDRLVKALLRREHVAKIVVGPRVIRINADGLPALLGGLFVVLLQAQGVRPVAQNELAVFRLVLLPQLVRLAVLLDRVVNAPLRREHAAKTDVGLRVLRIDADGLPAFLGGLFIVTLQAQRVAPVVHGALALL